MFWSTARITVLQTLFVDWKNVANKVFFVTSYIAIAVHIERGTVLAATNYSLRRETA